MSKIDEQQMFELHSIALVGSASSRSIRCWNALLYKTFTAHRHLACQRTGTLSPDMLVVEIWAKELSKKQSEMVQASQSFTMWLSWLCVSCLVSSNFDVARSLLNWFFPSIFFQVLHWQILPFIYVNQHFISVIPGKLRFVFIVLWMSWIIETKQSLSAVVLSSGGIQIF